jgi:hypothetical protein
MHVQCKMISAIKNIIICILLMTISCASKQPIMQPYYPLIIRPGIMNFVLVQNHNSCSLYCYGNEPRYDEIPPRLPAIHSEIPIGSKLPIIICDTVPMELFYPSISTLLKFSSYENEFMSPLVAIKLNDGFLSGYFDISRDDYLELYKCSKRYNNDIKYCNELNIKAHFHRLESPIKTRVVIGVFDGYAYNFTVTYGVKYVFIPDKNNSSEYIRDIININSIPSGSFYYCIEAAYLSRGKSSTFVYKSRLE